MTNYKSFVYRIKEAQSNHDLKALEKSLDRLFNAGIFTVNEYSRLDNLIMIKFYKIEK